MPNQKMIKIDQSHQCCIRCARDIRLLGYQDKDVLYMQDNDMNIHCNKIYQTQNDAQSKEIVYFTTIKMDFICHHDKCYHNDLYGSYAQKHVLQIFRSISINFICSVITRTVS